MTIFSKKINLAGAFLLLSCIFINNLYAADAISDTMLKQKEGDVVTACSTTMEALYLAANPTGSASKFDKFKSAAKNLLGKSTGTKVTNDMYNQASNTFNTAISAYYDSKSNTAISNTQKFVNLNAIESQCQTAQKMLG